MRLFSRANLYWLLVGLLFALSGYFTWRVEFYRGQTSRARLVGELNSGTEVVVTGLIDSDELTVTASQGGAFVVRILGIKGFDPTSNEPIMSPHGQAALGFLEAEARGQTVSLVFDEFKKDDRGRVLSYLELDGRDLGLELVSRGHTLVYTRYGFSRERAYLEAEATARQGRLGIWSSPRATERALALKAAWEMARDDD